MPTYEVTIRACVTKTLLVTADTQDEAYELAHDQFSWSMTRRFQRNTKKKP